jgi:2-dehydro-3-deoxy-D-gluconate 5-dehydrogenase
LKCLAEKVAIVTGGGRRLGRAISLAHAKQGASVELAGRLLEPPTETVATIQAAGGTAAAQQCDVSGESSIYKLVDFVVPKHERVDFLVNDAGAIVRRPAIETTPEEWRSTPDINLSGRRFARMAADRKMLHFGSGKVINIASTAGAGGRADMAAHFANKAGVINLTRPLAVEWAPEGVYVNAIAPGRIDTDMGAFVLATSAMREHFLWRIPLRRIGQPQDIGLPAVFLASSDSDMVTGEVVFIDGGVNAP